MNTLNIIADINTYLKRVLLPCAIAFFLYLAFFNFAYYYIDDLIYKMILLIGALLSQLLFMYFIGCNRYERNIIIVTIKSFIKR